MRDKKKKYKTLWKDLKQCVNSGGTYPAAEWEDNIKY